MSPAGIGPAYPAYPSARLVYCPREESNLYLRFRKPLFYPLNYEDVRQVGRGRPVLYFILFFPMIILKNLAQAFVGDMGVDLGGSDGGVAEHFLHAADVGAILQKVGGEAVPQAVRSNPPRNAGNFGAFFNQPLDAAGR